MNVLLTSFIIFVIGFVLGFVFGNFSNRFWRQWMYRHKLYGIDTEESARMFLMSCVTIIWFVANALALSNGKPVDLALQAIFGTIVGAYFGVQLVKKKK